jgi:putative membrane protein
MAPEGPMPPRSDEGPIPPPPLDSAAAPSFPPAADDARARRLHPASPLLVAVAAVPRVIFPALVVGLSGATWVFAAAGVVLMVSGIVAYLRTEYSLTSEQFVHRSGWFNRQTKVISPERVQQVQMIRKLRHQATGTTMVRIELAGTGGHVVLDAVAVDEAVRLHDALERGRRRSAAVGTPGEVPAPPGTVLFEVTTAQLVVGGLTGASLLLVPTLLAAAAVELVELADFTGVEVTADRARAMPALVLAVVGVALVGGLAAVQMVLRHHRLTITRIGPDLRAERGLLERRSTVIPLRRVQLVSSSDTVVRRLVGLRSVDVRTAAVADTEGTGSFDNLIPVARPADADRVAAILAGFPTPDSVPSADRRHPPVARRRAAVRRMAVLGPLGAVVGVPSGSWVVAATGVAAGVAMAAVWAAAWYPRLRHVRSADDDAPGPVVIVCEDGLLRWRRRIVPAARVQSAAVRQTPFQRRARVADLYLDIAGGKAARIRDLSLGQAADLVAVLDGVALRVTAIGDRDGARS